MSSRQEDAAAALSRTLGWSQEETAGILKKAADEKAALSTVLIDRGVREEVALAVACQESGLPPVPADWMQQVVDFDISTFDPVLLWRIPAAPFGWEGKKLKVAFIRAEDALHRGVLGAMEVQPHLAMEKSVMAALFRLVGGPPEKDTVIRTNPLLEKAELLALSFPSEADGSDLTESATGTNPKGVWATDPRALVIDEETIKNPVVPDRRGVKEPDPADKTVRVPNRLGAQGAIDEAMTVQEQSGKNPVIPTSKDPSAVTAQSSWVKPLDTNGRTDPLPSASADEEDGETDAGEGFDDLALGPTLKVEKKKRR
jgi:hypothetical protein